MNSLDDHELLLWAVRGGLTRDEARQATTHDPAHPPARRRRVESPAHQFGYGGCTGYDGSKGLAVGVNGVANGVGRGVSVPYTVLSFGIATRVISNASEKSIRRSTV